MMRKIVSLVMVLSASCVLSTTPSSRQPTYGYATSAPPAPQYENPGSRRGYTWVKGRWNWVNGQWQWEAGYWQESRQGSYWNDGYWEERNRQWVWIDGRWDNRPPTTVYDHSRPQPQPQPHYPQQEPPVVVRPNPQPQPYPQQPPPQPQPMGRPTIFGFNPGSGRGGTQVRIQGDFFSPEDYVQYNNVKLRVLSQSRTHFDVLIPVGLPAGTSGTITVFSPRGQVSANQPFYITN
jgi:WXXGXW repeat (2 copies)